MHTAWGRTLKDVFQRYKALRGYHQRYQNGFDCQGLWIEVGVERALGLNSKREIEEYGLAEFARRCREVVVASSRELTKGSIRLGQWMDWGNDYFTFSDTNIEYIWRFLRDRAREGLARRWATARPSGARAAARRSRRTSCTAATRTGSTRRSSCASRCSTAPGECDRDLDDDAVDAARERRRRRQPDGRVRAARERRLGRACALFPDETLHARRLRGAELVGLRYERAVRHARPGLARSSTA